MLSIIQTIEYSVLSKEFENTEVGVYDYIPSDDKLYIVIGDVKAEKYDTKTTDGYEVVSSIYVYGHERTQTSVKKVLQKIHNSFQNFEKEVNGFNVEYYQTQSISSLRIDVDLVQGNIEIKYRLEEI